LQNKFIVDVIYHNKVVSILYMVKYLIGKGRRYNQVIAKTGCRRSAGQPSAPA